MAAQENVRRIAMALPETSDDPHAFRFFVDGRQFLWAWNERVDQAATGPQPSVIAVRVAHELDEDALFGMDPSVFFTEPPATATPRSSSVSMPSMKRSCA